MNSYRISFESYYELQCYRVAGKPHSSDYWEQNGITDPTRDDYIFHIEFNHVHDYGLGIQSDFGGIYAAASRKCEDLPIEEVLDKCYTYKHIFNNLIHDVHVYNYGGTLIYTDAARLDFCLDSKYSYAGLKWHPY